ncbi:conserved hypothetical protein [uncultured delta proteobacterium]|uniref:NAD(+) diphosphatase n=1 Tax=uncultured delta proteobacterium TaxID=34034 RepID=A0A212KDE9_9DELT|nr:conserved hypothetical protein [uncultured delta proteobacterium]
MTQNNQPMWFIFHDKKLLLLPDKKGEEALLRGEGRPFASHQDQDVHVHVLGTYDGAPCYACTLKTLPPEAGQLCVLTDLRSSYPVLGENLYVTAGKGSELIHWDSQTRFCPACGAPTQPKLPISKSCPKCGNELFPNIALAIIVLVRRGEEALLVRAHTFRGTHYGLVAGFLEPGETLEECVAREVREETGISIKNIRYFGSQPWPYPSGLMVGFTADYQNGDLTLQQEELAAGAFFSRDNLPDLPAKLSIARRLIDAWIDGKP